MAVSNIFLTVILEALNACNSYTLYEDSIDFGLINTRIKDSNEEKVIGLVSEKK